MRTLILSVLTTWFLLALPLQADQVHLKNGDRLTGTIVKLVGGKMTLDSDLAGQITLDVSNIATFASDSAIAIHLQDGTVLHQPVTAAEPNEFAVAGGKPLREQTFHLAEVASINPPPKPKPKWTGSVSGSVTSTHGNTKAESVAGSVNLGRRSEKDRTTASADYARSEQTDRGTGVQRTTENWWRALGQYDYFFTKKFFGFVNGRYEKDDIAMLDRRVIVGGGAGYQWIEKENLLFSTDFGLASLYEKFEASPTSNSELSFQAGYDLAADLSKNLKFLHDLTYYPSLGQFSDYYLTTTAELRAAMIKNLFASLRIIFNFDATPAPGQGSTDLKYLLGVGLTF